MVLPFFIVSPPVEAVDPVEPAADEPAVVAPAVESPPPLQAVQATAAQTKQTTKPKKENFFTFRFNR